MLYMEDYLEMIEHLPQELKDRFTEMRELDLQVLNTSDVLDDKVKKFFAVAKRYKTPEREAEFLDITKGYEETLQVADEKVGRASALYDLVERYYRKLDQELYKFKMELEADNAGITEILEKRSLELDANERGKDIHGNQKENRYSHYIKTEKKSERKSSHDKHMGASSYPGTPVNPMSYTLGHIGAGGSAIAAAASQAIAATQQMQQGRRTASLKASYEAVNHGIHTAEFSVGPELLANNTELQHAAQQALAATTSSGAVSEQKKHKRKSQHSLSQDLMLPSDDQLDEPMMMDQESLDWVPDPSEQRYCFCNQVSYGDMVACDSPGCAIEWFHYGCVGVVTTPRGKWYCPSCITTVKKRGRKSKHEKRHKVH